MDPLLRIVNLVLFVVNIALFSLWFSLIRKDAIPAGGDAATYLLSELTLVVTALGIIVALGAVIMAGLGIFGFQAISERVVVQADRSARDTVTEWLAKRDSEKEAEPSRARTKNPVPMVARVTEEKEES